MVIYQIKNLLDGKVYIGQTRQKRHKARWSRHTAALNRGIHENQHLQNAWKKYGKESFIFEKLEDVCQGRDIDKAEQEWISKFRSNEREYGYNKTPGGGGSIGVPMHENTRAALSAANTGRKMSEEQKREMIARNTGVKRSEESRKKMSESAKKRFTTEEGRLHNKKISEKSHRITQEKLRQSNLARRKPIVCLNDGKEYASLGEASLTYGIDKANISRVCKGVHKQINGYIFQYIQTNLSPS